jgi:hypothetical protein
MLDIIITHIYEILPYYMVFETFYYLSNKLKIFYDFNHAYFFMHFIINLINTIILIPFIGHLISDPLGYNIIKSDWDHLDIIYPMIIGLHTFHLIHHLNKINYDEIIHHIITHVFWYIIYIANNPIYLAGIISMSGIPGGITYLMLFLQKCNLVNLNISKNYEKKISMYLNIWVRMPLCIIFATIIYIIGCDLSNNLYYGSLFMALFTIINGVHFMHNIIESYYTNENKNN